MIEKTLADLRGSECILVVGIPRSFTAAGKANVVAELEHAGYEPLGGENAQQVGLTSRSAAMLAHTEMMRDVADRRRLGKRYYIVVDNGRRIRKEQFDRQIQREGLFIQVLDDEGRTLRVYKAILDESGFLRYLASQLLKEKPPVWRLFKRRNWWANRRELEAKHKGVVSALKLARHIRDREVEFL